MDISKINEGDVIKNYPELCRLLGIQPTKGRGRRYHFIEFDRYFSYTRDGNSFIITEIYEQPLEKIDMRIFGNNTIYMKKEELILLDYLARTRETDGYNNVEMTTLNIALLTGMCKSEYILNFKSGKEIASLPEVGKNSRDMFYQRVGLKINKAVEQLLSNLKRRYVLTIEEKYKIGEYGSKNANNHDDRGELLWRTADEEETEKINRAKHDVLKNMGGYETLQPIIRDFRLREFYRNLNLLIKGRYGWWRVYSVNVLGFTEDIETDIEEYKRDLEEVYQEKKELNSILSKHFDDEAERKFKKNRDEYNELFKNTIGDFSGGGEFKLLEDDYLDNQKLLTDTLIRFEENKKGNTL